MFVFFSQKKKVSSGQKKNSEEPSPYNFLCHNSNRRKISKQTTNWNKVSPENDYEAYWKEVYRAALEFYL